MSAKTTGAIARARNLDPRDELRQRDGFTMAPDTLMEWFAKKKLGCAAQFIYWHMWKLACLSKSYVVAVPIRTLAEKYHLNESTVIRAIKTLIEAGALRRTRRAKGSDRYREPVALTEVLLPIEVCRCLPSLRERSARKEPTLEVVKSNSTPGEGAKAATAPNPPATKLAIPPYLLRLSAHSKLTDQEVAAWLAWKGGKTASFEFSPNSRLTDEEKENVRNAKPLVVSAVPKRDDLPAGVGVPQVPRRTSGPRLLDIFTAERLRKRLAEIVPENQLDTYFREVAWSLEHASFAKYESLVHAINVCLKLIREKRWQQPMRMPATWKFVPREERGKR